MGHRFAGAGPVLRAGLVALGLVALLGCPKAPAANATDAGADVIIGAPRPPPSPPRRRLFGYARGICVTDGTKVDCGRPDAGNVFILQPHAAMPGVAAASRKWPCWLRDDGVALCHDAEVARDVKSVEGAPYLLKRDGTIVVAPHRETDDYEKSQTPLRIELVKQLPPIERIVESDFHTTCAQTMTGDVTCWSEPRMFFNDEVEGATLPHLSVVPGVHDAAEIAMMPWLMLCVRTRSGAVQCSRSFGLENNTCALRGKSDVRCGDHRLTDPGPWPLVEPSYDARRAFERPLEPVPGLDGADPAKALLLWQQVGNGDRVSPRLMYQGNFDEGGCAVMASGAVRCFERDPCSPRQPWRSAAVTGLPPDIARVVLGAEDGYAITSKGALHRWPRRKGRTYRGRASAEECKNPTTSFVLTSEPVELPAPVVDIFGQTTPYVRAKGAANVDCVTLANGELRCWKRKGDEHVLLTVVTRDGGAD